MWIPRSEADVQMAISEGSLRENVHLDMKRESGANDGARKEMARDLASFSIYGGALLIGVEEDMASGQFTASPQPLAGLSEKVEQIAANRIDPPLVIRTFDIPSEDDPTRGYLFVEIPPSPQAPHMTDGRYYARADRTRRTLTNAEVVALHSSRVSIEARIRTTLAEWADRPLLPPSYPAALGHLYVVAEPISQTNQAAYQAVSRASNNSQAFALAAAAEKQVPSAFREFTPLLSSARNWVLRSEGGAFTTLESGVPRMSGDHEGHLVELEVHDNGGFRIVMGRATHDDSGTRWLFDFPIVGYVRVAVELARLISETTEYRGNWAFAVRCDNISDAKSYELRQRHFMGHLHGFSSQDYEAATTAHFVEIEDDPFAVVDRLVANLLHALGSYETYLHVRAIPQ